MIPAALCLLAVLDGVFAGFRAAAGRDLRIRKRGRFIRAMLIGGAAGAAAMAVEGAVVATYQALAPGPLDAPFARSGAILLAWYGPYAALVLLSLLAYITLAYEVRSLATVIVLGPMTMARPWLVAAGACHASLAAPRAAPVVLAGALLVLATGVLLDRGFSGPLARPRRARAAR